MWVKLFPDKTGHLDSSSTTGVTDPALAGPSSYGGRGERSGEDDRYPHGESTARSEGHGVLIYIYMHIYKNVIINLKI